MDDHIEAFLDEDLPPDEAARFEAHLATDGWEEELLLARQIRDGLRALPVPPCPPEVTHAVLQQARREARASRRLRLREHLDSLHAWLTQAWRPLWQPALAMSMLLALVVAVGTLGRGPQQPTDDPEVAQALAEAKWTLAFLSEIGRETSRSVRSEALEPHVVAPMNEALGPLGNQPPTRVDRPK